VKYFLQSQVRKEFKIDKEVIFDGVLSFRVFKSDTQTDEISGESKR